MTKYDITRPGFTLPAHFCIAPKSFQADRTIPDVDTIIQPARQFGAARWSFVLEDGESQSKDLGRRAKLMASVAKPTPIIYDQMPVFDARIMSPSNFAHFTCFHVPMMAETARQLGCRHTDLKVILPANVPDYIKNLATLFELDVLFTDAPVQGQIVTFEQELTQDELRTGRRKMIEHANLPTHIARQVQARNPATGPRVFLARRGSRALENNDEIKTYLERRGYEMIYAEDLPLIDQFGIMQNAERLVAIHGAGIAPMLYLNNPQKLRSFIEITPVGLTSTYFREMAHALGLYHITVRGRLKPAYVPDIYEAPAPFLAFQNDTFHLDVDALDHALNFATDQIEVPPGLPV